MPYWTLDLTEAVNYGYCVAVYQDNSGNDAVDRKGFRGSVKDGTRVLMCDQLFTLRYFSPDRLIEMGIITKKLQKQFGLDNPVYYAELNWTALMKVIKKNEVLYTEISKFPAVSRDLALLVDTSVEFAQIEQIARQTEKKLLKQVELFDVYEGEKLPAGKKSYAVNFILQDEEKTMGDKQIDAIMQKLIANLKKQLNAELR